MGEQQTLIGTIASVIFQNDENGYAVVRLVTDDGELITVTGCIPCAAPGEELAATGSFVVHPAHGEQFAADEVERHMPTGESDILDYLASGVIRGIGPATAQKLVERFGADFQLVIRSNGLSEETSSVLRDGGNDGNKIRENSRDISDEQETRIHKFVSSDQC